MAERDRTLADDESQHDAQRFGGAAPIAAFSPTARVAGVKPLRLLDSSPGRAGMSSAVEGSEAHRARRRGGRGGRAAAGRAFTDFDLPEPVMRRASRAAGFTHCTPIQEKVLPLSLAGRDVAGQAQTGTGKTAAFLITLFTRLLAHERPGRPAAPRALVIAPTRELVVQIADDARLLGAGDAVHHPRGLRRHRLPQAARRRARRASTC